MPPNGNRPNPSRTSELAGVVRARRRARGLTQTDLALLAGVGRRFVSDLENAKESLVLDKVDRVLSVFGLRLGVVERPRSEESLRSLDAHEETLG